MGAPTLIATGCKTGGTVAGTGCAAVDIDAGDIANRARVKFCDDREFEETTIAADAQTDIRNRLKKLAISLAGTMKRAYSGAARMPTPTRASCGTSTWGQNERHPPLYL